MNSPKPSRECFTERAYVPEFVNTRYGKIFFLVGCAGMGPARIRYLVDFSLWVIRGYGIYWRTCNTRRNIVGEGRSQARLDASGRRLPAVQGRTHGTPVFSIGYRLRGDARGAATIE
jgi:hypothetical protein